MPYEIKLTGYEIWTDNDNFMLNIWVESPEAANLLVQALEPLNVTLEPIASGVLRPE